MDICMLRITNVGLFQVNLKVNNASASGLDPEAVHHGIRVI